MADFAPISLADIYSKAAAVRGAQQGEQMNALKMRELQRQMALQDQLRSSLSDMSSPDGSIDIARAAQEMFRQDPNYHNLAAYATLQKSLAPPKPGGLYGGVQVGLDKTGKPALFSFDENTRQAVPLPPPAGIEATMGQTVLPVLGQNGPEFMRVPNRFAPGAGAQAPITPIPGIKPQPSASEAENAAARSTGLDMIGELKNLYESGAYNVGPVAGRKLSAKGLTGVKLSEGEARALSMERKLETQLLDAMRGAQVGPAEQKMFREQLPNRNQPEELYKANIDYTQRNLQDLDQRISQIRSVPASRPGSAPKYNSAAEVRAAFQSGKLSREEARAAIQKLGGIK